MKKTITVLFILCAIVAKSLAADSTHVEKGSSLCIGFGQDSYFGPYITAMGTYDVNSKIKFVYYANYWANFAFADMSNGTNFWTETGAGASISFLHNTLTFVPTVGLTYGKVLSGGTKGVMGDGITPGFYTSLILPKIDVSQGAYYFKALRQTGPFQNNFIWIWASPGYRFSPKFTAGIHYDHLIYHSNDYKMSNLYVWLGPFIQYNSRQGHYLKVTSGYDAINGEYFKANLNIVIF